jgi:hypothetical protein
MKTRQHHVFSTKPTQKQKAPSASAVLKLNFNPYRVADAKNLISRNGRTTRRDAYQSQQGMMNNEARKKSREENLNTHTELSESMRIHRRDKE